MATDRASGSENGMAQAIVQRDWRQGSTLPPSLYEHIVSSTGTVPGSAIGTAFILTGDCNIVHHDFDVEPTIEVLWATAASAVDGNYTQRKNPRVLHIELGGGNPGTLEFRVTQHGRISRAHLADADPSTTPNLTTDQRRLLAEWWAVGRYLRSSFPDAFNRRLSAVNGKKKILENLLKGHRDDILGVFVKIKPDLELPVDRSYDVILRMVLTSDADRTRRDSIEAQCYEPFLDNLQAANGLNVIDDDLLSEEDFPYSDSRRMHRLEYEHLSFDGPGGASTGSVPPRD